MTTPAASRCCRHPWIDPIQNEANLSETSGKSTVLCAFLQTMLFGVLYIFKDPMLWQNKILAVQNIYHAVPIISVGSCVKNGS
jgi:hypothetical protein